MCKNSDLGDKCIGWWQKNHENVKDGSQKEIVIR